MTIEQKDFLFSVYREIGQYKPFSHEVCAFIASQFALESNFGRSPLAVIHSNYCGMKFPLVRPNVATRADDTFAAYPALCWCVCDYVLCLSYHRPLHKDLIEISSFKFFLSKFYCPERDYIKRVSAIYDQFINLLNS